MLFRALDTQEVQRVPGYLAPTSGAAEMPVLVETPGTTTPKCRTHHRRWQLVNIPAKPPSQKIHTHTNSCTQNITECDCPAASHSYLQMLAACLTMVQACSGCTGTALRHAFSAWRCASTLCCKSPSFGPGRGTTQQKHTPIHTQHHKTARAWQQNLWPARS